jgi:hypothetical protein
MGWITISNKDKHELFKDFDVWTLRWFLMVEVQCMNLTNPDVRALADFIGNWLWLGPGVIIGTDYDSYEQGSPSRKKLMLDLLERTVNRIRSFGDVIPLSYLDEHINDKYAYYTQDKDTERFISVAQRLFSFLQSN